jgi:hypothetical protein
MSVSERPPYGRGPGPGGMLPGQPLRLGHLVPERLPVVISRPNPDYLALAPDDPRRASVPELVDVILQGYVFGPRCPGVVKAELASVEEAYLRAINDLSARAEAARAQAGGSDATIYTSDFVAAWHTFLRETIVALVPGMTPGEADVLAAVPSGEEGPGTALLRYLGVWDRSGGAGADDPPTATPAPEDGAPAPSTTASSSPTSSPSTDSPPASS